MKPEALVVAAARDLMVLQPMASVVHRTVEYARCISGLSQVWWEPQGATTSQAATRIPVVYGKRTWGYLCLEGPLEGLAPPVRRRLQLLAELSARAMRNAHVYARLRRRVKGVSALAKVGATIASTLNLEYLLDMTLSVLQDVVPYDAAGIYLLEADGVRLRAVALRGYRPDQEKAAMAKLGHGVIGWAATQGTDVLVEDVSQNPHYICAREQTKTEMVALLKRGDKLLGAFNVESDTPGAYQWTDLVLLRAFASQAAVAVDNALLARDAVEKRRLDTELALARDIQRRLLPLSAPEVPGWDLAGVTLTATRIGGDYYDFIQITPGVLGITVADVAGKGVPAALVMATFRASLLAEIMNEYSIEVIMRKVNHLLIRSTEPSVFVTAIYGALQTDNGVLTYCNAGHIEPLLVTADGTVRPVAGSDLILGAFEAAVYHQRLLELRPGDVLVLTTDGLVEARGPGGHEFGLERAGQVVAAHRGARAAEIRDRLIHETIKFTADQHLMDDLTVMVVKRGP